MRPKVTMGAKAKVVPVEAEKYAVVEERPPTASESSSRTSEEEEEEEETKTGAPIGEEEEGTTRRWSRLWWAAPKKSGAADAADDGVRNRVAKSSSRWRTTASTWTLRSSRKRGILSRSTQQKEKRRRSLRAKNVTKVRFNLVTNIQRPESWWRCGIIQCDTKFARLWCLARILLYVYAGFEVPFDLAFGLAQYEYWTPYLAVFIPDLFFLVDLVLVANVLQVDPRLEDDTPFDDVDLQQHSHKGTFLPGIPTPTPGGLSQQFCDRRQSGAVSGSGSVSSVSGSTPTALALTHHKSRSIMSTTTKLAAGFPAAGERRSAAEFKLLGGRKQRSRPLLNPWRRYWRTGPWREIVFDAHPNAWLDLAALAPLHGALWLPGRLPAGVAEALTVPRLGRMFKLMRWFNFRERDVHSNDTKFAMFQCFVMLFGVTHLVGCLWWLLARLRGFGANTWVAQYKKAFALSGELTSTGDEYARRWDNYVLSLFWGFQAMTNFGYSGLVPSNEVEAATAILLVLVQVVYHAYILGMFFKHVFIKDPSIEAKRKELAVLAHYCEVRKLPYALRHRMRQHLVFIRKRVQPSQDALLTTLPPNLRAQIARWEHLDDLRAARIFDGFKESFLTMIAVKLCIKYLMPGEVLYRLKDVSRELALVKNGRINEFVDEAQAVQVRTVTPGGLVGAIPFFVNMMQPVHAVVDRSSDATIASLHKDDYEDISRNCASAHSTVIANLVASCGIRSTELLGGQRSLDLGAPGGDYPGRGTKRRQGKRSRASKASSSGSKASAGSRTSIVLPTHESLADAARSRRESGDDDDQHRGRSRGPGRGRLGGRRLTADSSSVEDEHARRIHLLVAQALKRRDDEKLCAWIDTASTGDAESLMALADSSMSVNRGDYDDRTLLHVAASSNDSIKVAELLLERGADVNCLDRWQSTPLVDAVREDNFHVASLLQAHGGKLSIEAHLLCDLVNVGDTDGVKKFIRFGADPTMVDYDHRTPLHLAAADGRLNLVTWLLDQPTATATLQLKDRWGHTPLFAAVTANHDLIAMLLFKAGAEFETSEVKELVFEAASRGNHECLDLLCQCGVNFHRIKSYDKRTPLMVAAAEGHLVAVDVLLNTAKVDVNVVDRWGSTALDEALRHRRADVATLIHAAGGRTKTQPTQVDNDESSGASAAADQDTTSRKKPAVAAAADAELSSSSSSVAAVRANVHRLIQQKELSQRRAKQIADALLCTCRELGSMEPVLSRGANQLQGLSSYLCRKFGRARPANRNVSTLFLLPGDDEPLRNPSDDQSAAKADSATRLQLLPALRKKTAAGQDAKKCGGRGTNSGDERKGAAAEEDAGSSIALVQRQTMASIVNAAMKANAAKKLTGVDARLDMARQNSMINGRTQQHGLRKLNSFEHLVLVFPALEGGFVKLRKAFESFVASQDNLPQSRTPRSSKDNCDNDDATQSSERSSSCSTFDDDDDDYCVSALRTNPDDPNYRWTVGEKSVRSVPARALPAKNPLRVRLDRSRATAFARSLGLNMTVRDTAELFLPYTGHHDAVGQRAESLASETLDYFSLLSSPVWARVATMTAATNASKETSSSLSTNVFNDTIIVTNLAFSMLDPAGHGVVNVADLERSISAELQMGSVFRGLFRGWTNVTRYGFFLCLNVWLGVVDAAEVGLAEGVDTEDGGGADESYRTESFRQSRRRSSAPPKALQAVADAGFAEDELSEWSVANACAEIGRGLSQAAVEAATRRSIAVLVREVARNARFWSAHGVVAAATPALVRACRCANEDVVFADFRPRDDEEIEFEEFVALISQYCSLSLLPRYQLRRVFDLHHGESATSMSIVAFRKSWCHQLDRIRAQDAHRAEELAASGSSSTLDRALNAFFIAPGSRVDVSFQYLGTLLAIYYALACPYAIAFLGRRDLYKAQHLGTAYAADAALWVSMARRCVTGYLDEHSVLVTDPRAITSHYAQTDLVFDMVSAWPMDLVVWLARGDPAALLLSRLPRMLRVRVLFKTLSARRRATHKVEADFTLLFAVFALFLHTSACVWYKVTSDSKHNYQRRRHGLYVYEGFGAATGGGEPGLQLKEYLLSLFWVTSAFVGMSVGNLHPSNQAERWCGIVACVFNLSFISCALGAATAFFSKGDETLQHARENLSVANAFLESRRLPRELEQRVRSCSEFQGNTKILSERIENAIFSGLSHALQVDVARYTSRPLVERVSCFKNCSINFLNNIATMLVETTLPPSTQLFDAGDKANILYIVSHGSIELYARAHTKGDDHSRVGASRKRPALPPSSARASPGASSHRRRNSDNGLLNGPTSSTVVSRTTPRGPQLRPRDVELEAPCEVVERGAVCAAMQFVFGLRHMHLALTSASGLCRTFRLDRDDYLRAIKHYDEEEDIITNNLLQSVSSSSSCHNESDENIVRCLTESDEHGYESDGRGENTGSGGANSKAAREIYRQVRSARRKKRNEVIWARCRAAADDKLDEVIQILRRSDTISIDGCDYDRRTPLHLAACNGNLGIVNYLIEIGADIDCVDKFGNTPLRDAIRHRRGDVIKVLRKAGATLKVSHQEAVKMLCEGAYTGNKTLVSHLVECGIDPRATDYDRRTALAVAASEGHEMVVSYLLDRGADVNAVDVFGGTPLSDALRHRKYAVARALVHAGGMVPKDERSGATLCRFAAEGRLEDLKAHVECGVDVNAADCSGRRALHLAASEDQLGVIEYLLNECGQTVDPSPLDFCGRTPLDEAKRDDRRAAVVLIENAGGLSSADPSLAVAVAEMMDTKHFDTQQQEQHQLQRAPSTGRLSRAARSPKNGHATSTTREAVISRYARTLRGLGGAARVSTTKLVDMLCSFSQAAAPHRLRSVKQHASHTDSAATPARLKPSEGTTAAGSTIHRMSTDARGLASGGGRIEDDCDSGVFKFGIKLNLEAVVSRVFREAFKAYLASSVSSEVDEVALECYLRCIESASGFTEPAATVGTIAGVVASNHLDLKITAKTIAALNEAAAGSWKNVDEQDACEDALAAVAEELRVILERCVKPFQESPEFHAVASQPLCRLWCVLTLGKQILDQIDACEDQVIGKVKQALSNDVVDVSLDRRAAPRVRADLTKSISKIEATLKGLQASVIDVVFAHRCAYERAVKRLNTIRQGNAASALQQQHGGTSRADSGSDSDHQPRQCGERETATSSS